MKVYISGPITGVPNGNQTAFDQAAAKLLDRGHDPVNPHDLHAGAADTSWAGYMRRDIVALMGCDAVVVLDGWGNSRGARIERELAERLGLWVADYSYKRRMDQMFGELPCQP